MNLKTLNSFIALAEELHFGRAASKCGISQPAISRLLRDLEADLGVKLLDRTSREVSLTQSGRGFLESARKAVAYADMAVRAAKAAAIDGIDRLTVGLGIGTTQPPVGTLIAQFKQAHPETQITLCQLDEQSIGAALADGDVDVAIAWEVSVPTGLYRRHLGTVPMAVLVPSGHKLEAKEPIDLVDLAPYSLILPARDRHPLIYDACRRYAAEAGFEPTIAIDVSTMADTLAMVAAGVGVGHAPVVPGIGYPGVSVLRQIPPIELHYELVWAHSTPSVEDLLSLCQEPSRSSVVY
ncbi:MAG: LysR family transcriptional regulator [Cyanobacteria bacterium P01_F01_bin.150]